MGYGYGFHSLALEVWFCFALGFLAGLHKFSIDLLRQDASCLVFLEYYTSYIIHYILYSVYIYIYFYTFKLQCPLIACTSERHFPIVADILALDFADDVALLEHLHRLQEASPWAVRRCAR